MPRSSDFSNLSSKIILFTSDIAFDQGKAVAALLAGVQKAFDGQVTTLPLPPNAPGDIPRIILVSSDGTKTLEAGPQRISVSFQAKHGQFETVDYQIKLMLQAHAAYEKVLRCRISRLAINLSRFLAVADPAMVIAHHFCREELLERTDDYKGALSRTETMELHAHKRFEIREGLPVNSWVRVKTVREGQERGDGVLIEQDINTLAERSNTSDFSRDQISEIVREMFAESSAIMELYFRRE
ncbi:MAG: hypothetical protein MN733_38095 [Nitrososphaera sp.]|nr:hypothetical protein [Nitrososphaera sp.]